MSGFLEKQVPMPLVLIVLGLLAFMILSNYNIGHGYTTVCESWSVLTEDRRIPLAALERPEGRVIARRCGERLSMELDPEY
jgi:hypothetical protein